MGRRVHFSLIKDQHGHKINMAVPCSIYSPPLHAAQNLVCRCCPHPARPRSDTDCPAGPPRTFRHRNPSKCIGTRLMASQATVKSWTRMTKLCPITHQIPILNKDLEGRRVHGRTSSHKSPVSCRFWQKAMIGPCLKGNWHKSNQGEVGQLRDRRSFEEKEKLRSKIPFYGFILSGLVETPLFLES